MGVRSRERPRLSGPKGPTGSPEGRRGLPLILFTAPFLSLVGNKEATVGVIMQVLARSVPPDAFLVVQNVVNDVVFAKNAPGVLSLGAILTIWAGSNVFYALTDALNHAFAIDDSRPWWKRTLICWAFVIGSALVGLIATVVLLDGEGIVQYITGCPISD